MKNIEKILVLFIAMTMFSCQSTSKRSQTGSCISCESLFPYSQPISDHDLYGVEGVSRYTYILHKYGTRVEVPALAELKEAKPQIFRGLVKKREEITEADVLSYIVMSIPLNYDICLTYKGSNSHWLQRNSTVDDVFLNFLDEQPSVYDCLVYLVENYQVKIYYLERKLETLFYITDFIWWSPSEGIMFEPGNIYKILPNETVYYNLTNDMTRSDCIKYKQLIEKGTL